MLHWDTLNAGANLFGEFQQKHFLYLHDFCHFILVNHTISIHVIHSIRGRHVMTFEHRIKLFLKYW